MSKLKGIILAGGTGSRLKHLTKVTNKHLLPIGDYPMVYHPLRTLISAGIKDIMIITGKEHAGDFLNLLGDGHQFGVNLTFRLQSEPNGIAGALSLCRNFAGENPIAVILGDNVFENELFPNSAWDKGAKIFLKEVPDTNRFGVATIRDDKVIKIVEKPKEPETNLAVTGMYIYDNQVWNVIEGLKPSERGELEITDVNSFYVKQGQMKHEIVKGAWFDCGTPESLLKASNFIKNKNK